MGPDLYAKLNPLFDEQLADLKKNYREGARIPTTKLLAPQRKKQKREAAKASKYTKEEQQMEGYWNHVFGPDTIFKSKELLDKEKEAVAAAILAAEREKAGADLMEALAAKEAEDED